MQSMSTDYHAAVAVTAATKDEADRVLAECAAKRDILRAVSGTPHEEATLRALASVYTDRPGYGEWDTPPFKRSRRGGTATTLCTVCCNGFEIAYKDRPHPRPPCLVTPRPAGGLPVATRTDPLTGRQRDP